MKRISLTIGKTGDVKVNDVTGMGSGCLEATQDIEKLLGVVDENSRSQTSSMYEKVDDLKLDSHRN